MTQTVVEIDSVSKTYDQLVAVDNVSLQLKKGQTLGLIGPNGAGKTTLLRMISTLAKPDSGDVLIDGVSVCKDPRGVRRKLGFMPAEFGSPRNLTIGEYLAYFACMYGLPKADRSKRIADVCELTDLSGREHVMVKGLSTGNKQRLLLAKTLLHDPELLVLDEPASGLDPRARTELRAIMRALAAMGKTTIISSHILPDIEETCDRIGIIEAGRLVVDQDFKTLKKTTAASKNIVRLRVSDQHSDRAMDLLKQLDLVRSCEQRDLEIVVECDEENSNAVLTRLLEDQIRVLRYVEDTPNLEEIFMQQTKGEVT